MEAVCEHDCSRCALALQGEQLCCFVLFVRSRFRASQYVVQGEPICCEQCALAARAVEPQFEPNWHNPPQHNITKTPKQDISVVLCYLFW
jgi:hypothetical protein